MDESCNSTFTIRSTNRTINELITELDLKNLTINKTNFHVNSGEGTLRVKGTTKHGAFDVVITLQITSHETATAIINGVTYTINRSDGSYTKQNG